MVTIIRPLHAFQRLVRAASSDAHSLFPPIASSSSSPPSPPAKVKIVEVGPRDGLQNEKATVSAGTKISLIEKLVQSGLTCVESGSFVSPRWVPQMASTSDVLSAPALHSLHSANPSLAFPVLVPNEKGLSSLLALSPRLSSEIAIFVSASEAFSKANLNCTISESLDRLAPVVERAKKENLSVRGYISVVVGCPFEGRVSPDQVADVASKLDAMGCYELSLGDTIGVGTPQSWTHVLEAVQSRGVDIGKLAAHCHDTYGTAVSNVLHCVNVGVKTVDASIAGLGGCPYSPGATGNVSTEDVVYALESSGISTGVLSSPREQSQPWDDLLEDGDRAREFVKLAQVGDWISKEVGRANASRAGRAALARLKRRKFKL